MIPYVAVDPPHVPPIQFENQAEGRAIEFKEGGYHIVITKSHSDGAWDFALSSVQSGIGDRLGILLWEDDFPTASRASLLERFSSLLPRRNIAANVDYADASGNVFELRRLTGFTWARLADLLNVDRRTLNNWVKGASIRDRNRRHIARTLEVLRLADRGSSKVNSSALQERTKPQDPSPFESIRAGNYEVARGNLSLGLASSEKWRVVLETSSWTGEYQSFAIHEAADGTELMEALPYVSEPGYRKRKIKRG